MFEYTQVVKQLWLANSKIEISKDPSIKKQIILSINDQSAGFYKDEIDSLYNEMKSFYDLHCEDKKEVK